MTGARCRPCGHCTAPRGVLSSLRACCICLGGRAGCKRPAPAASARHSARASSRAARIVAARFTGPRLFSAGWEPACKTPHRAHANAVARAPRARASALHFNSKRPILPEQACLPCATASVLELPSATRRQRQRLADACIRYPTVNCDGLCGALLTRGTMEPRLVHQALHQASGALVDALTVGWVPCRARVSLLPTRCSCQPIDGSPRCRRPYVTIARAICKSKKSKRGSQSHNGLWEGFNYAYAWGNSRRADTSKNTWEKSASNRRVCNGTQQPHHWGECEKNGGHWGRG